MNFAPPEWDAILRAAMKNDALGIRSLVEVGVSPSHANAVQQSALHIAALWGNVEAVEELLKYKAAVDAQNSMTQATPLHCAAQSMKGDKERRLACVERLMANGADVSLVDSFGKVAADYCDDFPAMAKRLQPHHPALFLAIDEGNVQQVQQLVQTGESYEEVFLGKTPFQYTLDMLLADDEEDQQNQDRPKLVGILQALLEAGANVNASAGAKGNNPVQALEDPVLPPLCRVCTALQNVYKNKDTPEIQLLEQTCQLLLQHNVAVTADLEQLLHTACRKNELQFAKLLVEIVHVNPNVKGRQGMTPLQFAARSGKTEMVQYLLSLDTIDVSIQDDRGQTALDAATVNNKQEVVALLEEHTANTK